MAAYANFDSSGGMTRQAWWWAVASPVVFWLPWRACWGDSGTVTGLVLALLLAASAVSDAFYRKIPNWSTYPAILWALGLSVSADIAKGLACPDVVEALGGLGAAGCLAGGVGTFGAALVVYRSGGIGGGDVKLVACLGSLVPWQRLLAALTFAFVAAAAFAIVSLIAGVALGLVKGQGLFCGFANSRQRSLPLGPFLAVGTLAALCLELEGLTP